MGEKVLILGSGSREHSFAREMNKSPNVDKVWCGPGNAGTAQLEKGENVKLDLDQFGQIIKFVHDKNITLTVVGPEQPLVDGIADTYEMGASMKHIFGPNKSAALLEGSKKFAKETMTEFGIPTAAYESFDNPEEAKDYLKDLYDSGLEAVVKADGLAAGKGVIVLNNLEHGYQTIDLIMVNKKFGSAGDLIVVEEKLIGEEASVIALCDGKTIKQLVSTQDHKPAFDGDKGPNTGGMGAYGPAPVILGMEEQIYKTILAPLVEGLNSIGITYKGIIYAGLIKTADGIKVLEFNVRGGDPEMPPITMLTDFDWYEACMACATGKLDEVEIKHKDGAACCVVMASEGYPNEYDRGKLITGLESVTDPNTFVFHAGTKLDEAGNLVTSGGRVLGVTHYGKDIAEAQKGAYDAVEKIKFVDKETGKKSQYFRTDIAAKAINR